MRRLSQKELLNFDFLQQFIYESYTPRAGDLFYHGSLKDFESINPDKDGLVYLTRDLYHAKEFAEARSENFGGPLSNSGFVYAYKIDPSAKIINAKDDENLKDMFQKGFTSDYGYTEIIQLPDVTKKILSYGWDGILQKQADLDYYGNRLPKYIKRHRYDKRDKEKEKWRDKIPMEYESSPWKGVDVLGIKPEFLIFVKKISVNEFDDNPKKDIKKFKYSKIEESVDDFRTEMLKKREEKREDIQTAPVVFTTERGSEYRIGNSGTIYRVKYNGSKFESDSISFVSSDTYKEIMLLPKKYINSVIMVKHLGNNLVFTIDDKSVKTAKSSRIPKIGLYPVDSKNGYIHVGHKIIKISKDGI